MTSKTLQERLLRTCYEFFDSSCDRFKQERNQDFFSQFEEFVKGKSFESLLKRGGNEDLKQQWHQYNKDKSREFHELLQGDALQKISDNALIQKMKKTNSVTNYDFETSANDILTVQDAVQGFVLEEASSQLRKTIEEPRFSQNQKAFLSAFLPESEKEKGLLTRIAESDPTLAQIKSEKSDAIDREQRYYEHLRALLYSSGSLMDAQNNTCDLLIEQMVEKAIAPREVSRHRFTLSEPYLKVQKIAAEIKASLAKKRDQMDKSSWIAAGVAVSCVSLQLKDLLRPCIDLLSEFKSAEHKGRELRLDNVMRKILAHGDNLEGVSKPAGGEQILERVKAEREFDSSAELISLMTGQDFASSFSVKQEVKEEWPTALENLYALVDLMRKMANAVKHDENYDVKSLFQRAFVIDQSPELYVMLLGLLKETKSLAASSTDKVEKELATYLFDGFGEIMLNNLQALYEAERAYLRVVFAKGSQKANDGGVSDDPKYLDNVFYPELLEMLLWRQKQRESCPLKDLLEWQKVIQLVLSEGIKEIYARSELEKQADLCQQHAKHMPDLVDSDTELPKVIATLDTLRTDENAESFKASVDGASDFIRVAIEQKSPAVSTLIREVFKRKLGATEDSGDKVCDVLAEQLKSKLFVASDNQRSKIANVVADLVAQGATVSQNSFTTSILRMLVADSVNMLKNIKEIEIEREGEKRPKLPWKAVIQKHSIRGSDAGNRGNEDGQKVVDEFDDSKLPRVTEFGLYTDGFVVGVKIVYSNGVTFDRKGDANHRDYVSLKMQRGEHITLVHGRVGCWTDQLRVETNMGRTLKGGNDDGGHDESPAYPRRAYFIGMDLRFHARLTRTEVYYIDLQEVPMTEQDPLITLISESDLLSKGLEQCHMGIFSQPVLQEIKAVQEIIGKPILDSKIDTTDGAASTSTSTTATTMINTGGLGMPPAITDDDDLHMQIIHEGSNELLDDFIQVLQLLLKESREPVRAQMNIMQENGMRATRACFAAIVKLSGLTSKLENVLQALELQEMDFEADEPAERLGLMKDAAKELGTDTPFLLIEWSNAVKMRKWLKDQCVAANIDTDDQNDKARLEAILQKVIRKAEFLIKLEKSPVFQSMSPAQPLNELSYKIPSYARDDVKDKDEIQETPGNEANLWREHYKSWKTDLKRQGTIRNQQEQHTKIRSIGTASIIVCMQHKEISSELLVKIVETNTLNSCYRLAGLQLLEFVLTLIESCSKEGKPNERTMMAVRNVAAALSMGIRTSQYSLATDESASSHYLDNVKSCGSRLEVLIRESFFKVVSGISGYFVHAESAHMLELLSCLDWSFKARDFEQLLDLKVFKLLHSGVARQVEGEEGKVEQQNIVLESWKLKPFGQLAKELKMITSNLYMGIVSRLAEPEARKIIFNKTEERATGVSSMTRASSVVNVNAAQALLAEEFNIMFREFHEFALVASKLGRYISFDTLSAFHGSGEPTDTSGSLMPELINTTMAKIIQNAPYEQDLEESKSAPAPEAKSAGKAFPAEKPWKKKPQKKAKVYDLCTYTEEQVEVLQQLDAGAALTPEQNQIHQGILALEQDSMVCGLFNEPEEEQRAEVPVEIFVSKLAKDDPKIPQLRQRLVQFYRDYMEDSNIARYIKMVEIFVKVATKAPYPLEMLQNVANPYHIKTLIRMLFQVSPGCKLQILNIFSTLLRIRVPLSIFDEGVKDLQISFRTPTQVEFQSSFAKLLFQAALQIHSGTWDSCFSEGPRTGMHDVCINLTRTVALCLKIQGQSQETAYCEDMSKACIQVGRNELSEQQVTTVMQVMKATCTMPVVGDHVIFSNDPAAANASQPETAELITYDAGSKVFTDIKYALGCIIVPEFVPDTEIPINLSNEALEALLARLSDSYGDLTAGSIPAVLEMIYIIKLLILQQKQDGEKSLSSISGELRKQAIRILAAISSYKDGESEDEGVYLTSLQEFALACQLRDQYETILPSGVDPFESAQAPPRELERPASLSLRPRRSTMAPGRKKNPASSKYAAQQVLNKAKAIKQKKGGAAGPAVSSQQKLINSMFSDILATDKELVEMVDAMVDVCRFSGCSLLELLYAINEALGDDKRFFTTDSIIEMYNDELEKLAENEDAEQDPIIEKQFVELVTKKLEKIASVHKPEAFKNELLPRLNLEEAIEEVEVRTQGKSNLMRARAEDRLYSNKQVYIDFANQMKGLQTVDEFERAFKADLEKSSKGSAWPLTCFPIANLPLQNDKSTLKCATVLVRRFAEMLLFKIYDPAMDTSEEAKELDIADVMANVQQEPAGAFSIKACYDQVYGSIAEGLKSYARSIEIFSKSHHVECAWEVSFTENFKIESNLTSDFSSLRKLDDYAYSRSILNLKSAGSMANQALDMLQSRILRQGSPEQKLRSQKFLAHLLKCVVTAVIDDFAHKVDPENTRYSSSMVSAISNQKPYYASSAELVERVRLLTCSVLKSDSVQMIGMLAPDLLNLTLFTVVYQKAALNQKRLLMDEAFQLVNAYEGGENLKAYVEMGSWERIVQSRVLKQMLEAVCKRSEVGQDIKKQSLFSVLLLELQAKISLIDLRAENFAQVKRKSKIEMDEDASSTIKLYKRQVTKKLSLADIQVNLLNDYLAGDYFNDKFKKEFEVPAVGEPISLDLGFIDGAVVQFKIEPQAGDDLEKLAQTQFTIKYSMTDNDLEDQSFKLFSDSEDEPRKIESRFVRVTCSASNQKTNIVAVNHDQKFRRDYGYVNYVVRSDDRKSTFFITDKAVYQEGEYGSKEITPVQEEFSLSENKISEIQNYGRIYIFKTETGAKYVTEQVELLKIDKIDSQKIMKEVVKEQIRAYITSDGKLYYQNLFQSLNSDADAPEAAELTLMDTENRLDLWREGDKIVDLHIGGKGCDKYAILTVNRNGNKILFSKRFSDVILKNCGRQEGDDEKFYMLAGQNANTSFEQVFVFDEIAFAVDRTGNLWVLGGYFSHDCDEIFPMDFGCRQFEGPTKSKLYEAVKNLLSLDDSVQIRVKDIDLSVFLILITIENTSADGSSETVLLSLTEKQGRYEFARVDQKKSFLLDEFLWHVVSAEEAGQEDAQQIIGTLKMVVKPLVRSIDNISMEMLAGELVDQTEQQETLKALEKLSNNEDLIIKVYRAMNNWVRAKIENRLPVANDFKTMIAAAEEEYKQDQQYNPLHCWNNQDSTQKDIVLLTKAFVSINLEINLRQEDMFNSTRRMAMTDPLLQTSLQKDRLNQGSEPASIDLSLKFCQANQFILSRVQDETFAMEPEEPRCTEDRIEVDFYRFKASQFGIDGKVDHGDGDTLFTQLFKWMEKEQPQNYKNWWRKNGEDRVFRANFKGEKSIDAGGPYRECMENISRELTSFVLPVLVPTENQRHEHGMMRECFVLNHQANTQSELKQIMHFGLIIGFAIRSMQAWNIALHPIIWKEIVGVPLDPDVDLKTSDKFMHQLFQNMRQQALISQTEEEFSAMIGEQCFTIDFGLGETEVIPGGSSIPVTRANLEQYIKIASLRILRKASVQMDHFLSGVYYVARMQACQSLSWRNVEIRAMGEPLIDMNILKQYTENAHSLPENTIKWFWEVLNEMEEEDKQKYLKFVNGRAKLQTNPGVGRKHKITNGRGGDGALPQSHTCFNQIDLPAYTNKAKLRENLYIAIRLCGEIDTD